MFGRTTLAAAAVFALSVLAASACSKSQSKTTIPATWRNPEFIGEPFSKLFVLGVGRNGTYQATLRGQHGPSARSAQGATAEASWVAFPENDKLDPAKVLSAVSQGDFDAIVITRLLSVDEEMEYVPGKPPTSSDLYMAGYDKAYAVNSDPGHYARKTKYRVETALYSARDGIVVWLVRSETVNPDSVEEVIQSVSSSVAKKMKADGLIH